MSGDIGGNLLVCATLFGPTSPDIILTLHPSNFDAEENKGQVLFGINPSGKTHRMTGIMLQDLLLTLTMISLIFLLATLILGNYPVLAQRNITVDDTDPAVSYTGSWDNNTNEEGTFYGGTHMAAWAATDTATFRFTGVAVYYLCPLWAAEETSTLLTLDSGPANWINLTSERNENSAVRWWKDGLENGPHQLVISLGQSPTGQKATWGEVDGFINSVAVIAVPVVGAVTALALGILAFLNVTHIKYLLSSLAFGLFGWFGFKARRIVISGDENLPSTQVFNIGNKDIEDDFILDIPCTNIINTSSSGESPVFGLATIEERGEGQSLEFLNKTSSPATLQEDLIWKAENEDVKLCRPRVLARSESIIPTKIAVGTYAEEKDDFKAFLVFNDFNQSNPFEHQSPLFLHVFRTNGYGAGQYGKALLSAIRDNKADRLTPERGFQFSKLSPLTTWCFRATKEGGIKFEVARNRQKDIREYTHKFKIHNDAMKGSPTLAGAFPPPSPPFRPVNLSFGSIEGRDMGVSLVDISTGPTAASAARPTGALASGEAVTSVVGNSTASSAGEISSDLPSLAMSKVDIGARGDLRAPVENADDEGWTPVTRKTSRSRKE
ncbi:hypothetical protein C8J57DRAFT_1234200 [Mycena rebaudengoi]|nr:hypothetical protein C8J57DRAFT_1234200 [Mycena rebaudengoi]